MLGAFPGGVGRKPFDRLHMLQVAGSETPQVPPPSLQGCPFPTFPPGCGWTSSAHSPLPYPREPGVWVPDGVLGAVRLEAGGWALGLPCVLCVSLATPPASSAAVGSGAPPEAEQAWPQSSGEEELQLQLALAMSKEEADQVPQGLAGVGWVWP